MKAVKGRKVTDISSFWSTAYKPVAEQMKSLHTWQIHRDAIDFINLKKVRHAVFINMAMWEQRGFICFYLVGAHTSEHQRSANIEKNKNMCRANLPVSLFPVYIGLDAKQRMDDKPHLQLRDVLNDSLTSFIMYLLHWIHTVRYRANAWRHIYSSALLVLKMHLNIQCARVWGNYVECEDLMCLDAKKGVCVFSGICTHSGLQLTCRVGSCLQMAGDRNSNVHLKVNILKQSLEISTEDSLEKFALWWSRKGLLRPRSAEPLLTRGGGIIWMHSDQLCVISN